MPEQNLTLGHDRLLADPLQFISHVSSFIRRYIVCVANQVSLNKLQINLKTVNGFKFYSNLPITETSRLRLQFLKRIISENNFS
jgi:hypothetical protein